MSKAQMKCKNCANEWTYSGLSRDSAYCPKCNNLNYIPVNAIKVEKLFGPKDRS